MTQSKKGSFIESCTNTAIGFIITWAFSPLIYGACGVSVNYSQITGLTFAFTGLSIARGYVIRRVFNKEHLFAKLKRFFNIN